MEQPPSSRLPGSARIERARNFVHDHFRELRCLDEIAAVSGLSKFHFIREFTRSFGISPLAYRNAVRMEEAQRLLGEGHPIKVVAADLGFTDQSHFGRVFRQKVGSTPAAYQRSTRSNFDGALDTRGFTVAFR